MLERTETHSFYLEDETPLQEKCGIVALYYPTDNVSNQIDLIIKAGGGVQHRGQQKVGIIMKSSEGLLPPQTGNGLIKDAFANDALSKYREQSSSIWMQLHTRYGTSGGYLEENSQPLVSTSSDGKSWSIIHNGEFVATDKIRQALREKFPDEVSDTFLFSKLLAEAEGETTDERVLNALSKVNGAYSLAIGIDDKMYLARDEFGIRPMVLGRINDGFIAASETFALTKIGIKPEFDIRRGEVIRIDKDGLKIIKDGFEEQGYPCAFEFAYFSHPSSKTSLNKDLNGKNPRAWQSIYRIRERSGIIVAEEMRDSGKIPPDIDCVIAAPDSGAPFAAGLAMGLGVPYRPLLIRDHYDQNGDKRLFQEANIDVIAAMIAGKVSPVDDPELFQGLNIILADDSMVRSNVATQTLKLLKEYGVNQAHLALGFSEVTGTCHLGVSMRTKKELIAHNFNSDSEKIAQFIGADSVNYISHIGLLRAMGIRKEDIIIPDDPKEIFHINNVCGGCMTGIYPISKEGDKYSPVKLFGKKPTLIFAGNNR